MNPPNTGSQLKMVSQGHEKIENREATTLASQINITLEWSTVCIGTHRIESTGPGPIPSLLALLCCHL